MPKSKSIPEPEDESPFYLRSDENADEPKTDRNDGPMIEFPGELTTDENDQNVNVLESIDDDDPKDTADNDYESSPEFKDKWQRIVSEGWPFPEDNAPEPPGAPGNEAEPEPQPVRSFDWVVKITSLDLPELLDYPKGTDEFDVAYRRVPTSIGPVPAQVGNYLAKSESGVHVLRTDPRGDGNE